MTFCFQVQYFRFVGVSTSNLKWPNATYVAFVRNLNEGIDKCSRHDATTTNSGLLSILLDEWIKKLLTHKIDTCPLQIPSIPWFLKFVGHSHSNLPASRL